MKFKMFKIWAFFFFVVCFAHLAEYASSEERQCSRYHCEAQTLERIIRAEIDLESMKRNFKSMEEMADKAKKENIDEISKISEKVDMLEHYLNTLMKNVSETKNQIDGSTKSSMRQFCNSHEMCSDVENSECNWMACKCKPGTSYHHGTRKCLPDCGEYGYGDTFQVEMDTVLIGYNTKNISKITLIDCAQRCTIEKSFVCRTAEYQKAEKVCHLSWETLHTNPEVHRKNRQDFVIYTRDCN